MIHECGPDDNPIGNSGHGGSDQRSTTGRLFFVLGVLPWREMDKLEQATGRLGNGSFFFVF